MKKERLVQEFIELVKVPSESKNERDFALLLKAKLEALGFETKIDESDLNSGSNTGNVLARLPGTKNAETLLFSAHMDTVSPGVGIEPIIDGNILRSSGNTILASDDKSAIAAFLEAIRVITENNIPHGTIEAAFTTMEEGGMFGAKNMDYTFFESKTAFVLDSGGKPGTVIVQAPAQDKIRVNIKGKAAHAGVEPEKGVSAIMVLAEAITNMNLLRIDHETTANIGTIAGGTVTNIVAEHCDAFMEARSLNTTKLDAQVQHMLDCLTKSCEKHHATMSYELIKSYPPLNVPMDSKAIEIARKASENLGFPFLTTSTGGGSDANILAGKGFDVVNLGVGMCKPHSVEEYIEIDDMVNTGHLIKEIILSV